MDGVRQRSDEASPSSPSADTQDGAVPQRRKSTFPGQAKILQEAQQRYWSQQLKHDSHLSHLKRQYEERIMTNQSQEPQGGPKRQGQASPEQRAQEDDEAAGSREIFFVAAIPQGDPATGMLVLPSFEFGYLEGRADFWGTSRGAYEAGEAQLSGFDSEVTHPVRIVPLESRVPEGHVPQNNGTIYPGSQSSLSHSNHEAESSSGAGQKPNPSRLPPEPVRPGPPVQPQPFAEEFTRPQAEGLDQAVPHPVNQGIQEPKMGAVRSPSGAPASSHPSANWEMSALWSQAASRTHTICLEEATWNQGTLPIQEMGFTPTLNGVGNSWGEGELSAGSANPRAVGSSAASQGIPAATPVRSMPSMPKTGVEAMRPERPPVKSRRKIITDFCCIFDGSLPEIDTDQVEALQQVLQKLDQRNVLVAWTKIRPTMTDYYPYGKSLVNALTAENATVRGMYFSPQSFPEGGLLTFVILEDAQVMANKLPLHFTVQADGETLEVDLSFCQAGR